MTATTTPLESIPVRRTTPVTTVPTWALALLGMGGLLLGAATVGNDVVLARTLALVFVALGSVVVLYRRHVGVLVIMSTMLMSYPSALKGIGPLTINNLLGLALLIILLFQLYRDRDYWFLKEPEIRLLFLIGLVLMASLTLNMYFLPEVRHMLPKVQVCPTCPKAYGDVNPTSRWVFEFWSRIAFTIFFVNWIRNARQLRWVLYLMAFCIVAVLPTLGPDIVNGRSDFRITSKLIGWAENVNRFAFMVNVGIALFVYLAVVLRSWPMKLASLACAAGLVPITLLTASRSGFLGLLIVGLVLLRSKQISLRWKVFSIAGGTALATVVFFLVISPIHRERLLNLNPFGADHQVEGTRSTEVRVATLGEALDIIRRFPLTGVGLGNFRWVNMYIHGSWKPPHNSYVWSWAEGGILVTLLYLALFASVFWRIQSLRPKYVNHPVVPHLPDWLHLYMILLLFFSIFADVWLEVHIYFIIAIAIVLSRWASDEEARGWGRAAASEVHPTVARRQALRALYAKHPA